MVGERDQPGRSVRSGGPQTDAEEAAPYLAFSDFVVDLHDAELRRDGRIVPLRPKSFDMLCCLAQNAGHLVTREQLLHEVWGGAVVTSGSITQCLIDIRRALGDEDRTMVRTVPRRGLVFDLPVKALTSPAGSKGRLWFAATWLLPLGTVALVLFALLWYRDQSNGGAAPPDPDTVVLVDQARHQVAYQWQLEELETIKEQLETVLHRYPEYLPALRLLTVVFQYQADHRAIPQKAGWDAVESLSQRILAINPDDPEAIGRLGVVALLRDGDVTIANERLSRALAGDPDNVQVLLMAASYSILAGEPGDGIHLLESALDLDPMCARCFYLASRAYRASYRLKEAESAIRHYRALSLGGEISLAEILFLDGRLEQLRKFMTKQDRLPWRQTAVAALAAHQRGDMADFHAILAQIRQAGRLGWKIELAKVAAWLGDSDRAFYWLEQGGEGAGTAPLKSLRHPFLQGMQADPRWNTLIEQPGLAALNGEELLLPLSIAENQDTVR